MKDALSQSSGQGGLLDGVKGLLTSAETGGLEGLMQRFRDKDLCDTIASWIGTGENKPISQEKIQQVLETVIFSNSPRKRDYRQMRFQ